MARHRPLVLSAMAELSKGGGETVPTSEFRKLLQEVREPQC